MSDTNNMPESQHDEAMDMTTQEGAVQEAEAIGEIVEATAADAVAAAAEPAEEAPGDTPEPAEEAPADKVEPAEEAPVDELELLMREVLSQAEDEAPRSEEFFSPAATTTDEAAEPVTEPAAEAMAEPVAEEPAGTTDAQEAPTTYVTDDAATALIEEETALESLDATTVAPSAASLDELEDTAMRNAAQSPMSGGSTIRSDDAMVSYSQAEEEKHAGHAAAQALKGMGFALIAIATAYLIGVVMFTFFFLPNTTINGESVSLMLASEVAERHTSRTDDYVLNVTGQDLDLKIASADVDMRSDGLSYVQDARRQLSPWLWPVEVLRSHNLTVDESITYDEKAVAKVVEDALAVRNKDATPPVDAKIEYDSVKHLYDIVPEQVGTALDPAAVTSAVDEALASLETSVQIGEEALVQPAVTSEDQKLVEAVKEVNTHLSAEQTLRVGEREVYKFDADHIAKFTKVDDNLACTVDHDALTKWCQGELSEELDSTGSKRSFVRPDGKQVTVSGGNYGWTIDGATLAETIAANIEAGTASTIEVPMLHTAQSWNPGGQEWGRRYIDIDIAEQHVRLYDDSSTVIWESDCVTGNTTEGHDTPLGVYYLNENKESGNIKLEGPVDERTMEPEYVSYVTYWMPFVWNSVALHDATWRYSFGGDIYKYDGSHGCVNLPADKAAQLYDLCKVGDVVVVHY